MYIVLFEYKKINNTHLSNRLLFILVLKLFVLRLSLGLYTLINYYL